MGLFYHKNITKCMKYTYWMYNYDGYSIYRVKSGSNQSKHQRIWAISLKTTFFGRHLETMFIFECADSSRDHNITSLYINGKPRVSTFDFFLFERLAKKPVKDIARERGVYQKTYMYVLRNVSKTYIYVLRSEKVKYIIKWKRRKKHRKIKFIQFP